MSIRIGNYQYSFAESADPILIEETKMLANVSRIEQPVSTPDQPIEKEQENTAFNITFLLSIISASWWCC